MKYISYNIATYLVSDDEKCIVLGKWSRFRKLLKIYIWHVFAMVLHICVIADLLCFCVYIYLHWYLMQNTKYFMQLSSLFAELLPSKYLYHYILEYIQRWRVLLKKIFSAERVKLVQRGWADIRPVSDTYLTRWIWFMATRYYSCRNNRSYNTTRI